MTKVAAPSGAAFFVLRMNQRTSSSQALYARSKAAALSFGATAVITAVIGLTVFSLWYPTPFRQISGGNGLFLILVSADLVLGSVVTFVVFDPKKPRNELIRDLSVVALVQVAALAYGLYSMYEARPAALALERDRVRVVRAADLEESELIKAPPSLRQLPFSGRLVVAAQDDPSDIVNSVTQAMSGRDIGARPERWLPPSETAREWANGSRPVSSLAKRYPARVAELENAILETGLPRDRVGYIPLLARTSDWVVLVDVADGRIVGYAPFDGF